jgi:hypothetical protein
LALSDFDRDQIGDIANDPQQFNGRDQAIIRAIAASTPEQREQLRDIYPEHVAAFEGSEAHNGPTLRAQQEQEHGTVTPAGDLSQVVIPGTAVPQVESLLPLVPVGSGSVLLSAQTTAALDALKLSLEYLQKIRELIPQIEESRIGTPLLDGILVELDALGDEMEALVTPSPAERAIITARGQFAIHWLRRFVGAMKGA